MAADNRADTAADASGQEYIMAVIAKKKPKARRDAAATRARILHAETEEFADTGYDGARADEIPTQSEVKKNWRYDPLGTKRQQFVHILDPAYRPWTARQLNNRITDQ